MPCFSDEQVAKVLWEINLARTCGNRAIPGWSLACEAWETRALEALVCEGSLCLPSPFLFYLGKGFPGIQWSLELECLGAVSVWRTAFPRSPAKWQGFVMCAADAVLLCRCAFQVGHCGRKGNCEQKFQRSSLCLCSLGVCSVRWGIRGFGCDFRRALAVISYAQFFIFWLVNSTFVLGFFCFHMLHLPEEIPTDKHPVSCQPLFHLFLTFPVPLFCICQ